MALFKRPFRAVFFCVYFHVIFFNLAVDAQKCSVSSINTDFNQPLYQSDDTKHCSVYNLTFIANHTGCVSNKSTIYIDIMENVTESQCNDATFVGRLYRPHSRLNPPVSITNTEMKITVPVSSIYSGCYNIRTIINSLQFPVKKWVKNEYTTFKNFSLGATAKSQGYGDYVKLMWEFHQLCFKNYYLTFEEGCEEERSKYSLNDIVHYNCSLEHTSLICEVYGFQNKNYTVTLRLKQNPQCIREDGVYDIDDYCSQHMCAMYPFGSPLELGTHADMGTNFNLIVIIAVFITLITCILIAYVYIKRRKVRNRRNTTVSYSKRSKGKTDGIFLVYAKDCEEFMNLMIAFRNILGEVMGCQVYDIYDDEDHEKYESLGDWIQSRFTISSIKIVLIESDVGKKIYEQNMEHYIRMDKNGGFPQLAYENKDFVDPYILFTLKNIFYTANVGLADPPYIKLHVCSISSVMKQKDAFENITPFIRYDLPDELHTLIRRLGNDSVINDIELMKQKFTYHLNILKTYLDHNPHYIKEMLLEKLN